MRFWIWIFFFIIPGNMFYINALVAHW